MPTRETVVYVDLPGAERLPPVIDYGSLPAKGEGGITRVGQAAFSLAAPGRGLKAGLHHSGPATDPDDEADAGRARRGLGSGVGRGPVSRRRRDARRRDVPLHEHRRRGVRARAPRPRGGRLGVLRPRIQVRADRRADARRARPRSGGLISEQLACTMRAMARDVDLPRRRSADSRCGRCGRVRRRRLVSGACPDRDGNGNVDGREHAAGRVLGRRLLPPGRQGEPGAADASPRRPPSRVRPSTELLDGPTSEESANGLASGDSGRDEAARHLPRRRRRDRRPRRSVRRRRRQRVDARSRRAGRRDAHAVPHDPAGRVPDRRYAGRRRSAGRASWSIRPSDGARSRSRRRRS